MSRTLPEAREAFIAAIRQDTPGADSSRLIGVLDALIAWSVARPDRLAFRTDPGRTPGIAFDRAGTRTFFWSAQVTRGTGPRLEVHAPGDSALADETRAMVMETLNAHSRTALVEGDRLRIGFGALKNDAARAAVLALMERLLVDSSQPAVESSR